MSGKFMMNGIEYLGGGSGGGGGNVDDVYVNGESVLDENKIAQVISYKEVTLAEYMALPDTKLNDGVMYCIKDVGSANQFPPLIYSDEEREVGVWRDGRPLYQKSFWVTTNLSSSFSVYHNISDFDFCTGVEGTILYNSGSGLYAEPICTGGEMVSGWGNGILDISREMFSFQVGQSRISASGLTAVNATIRYVKTTDTPGSGPWNTDGTYAKHYSTEEKVIGTWIDGKPLYERTYHTTAGAVNTYNQFDFGLLTSTISMIRLVTGYVEKGVVVSNISGYQVPSSDEQICGYIDKAVNGNVKFDYRLGSSIAGGDLYLTIQYTKTTD